MPIRALLVLPLVTVLACSGSEPESAPESDAAPDSAARAEAPAPPPAVPDSLPALVEDIRAGIAPIAAQVGVDHVEARRRVLVLYTTRMEVIEGGWGARGSRAPSPERAEAVLAAESVFHDLITLMTAGPPPDSVAVAGATAALDDALAAVLAAP